MSSALRKTARRRARFALVAGTFTGLLALGELALRAGGHRLFHHDTRMYVMGHDPREPWYRLRPGYQGRYAGAVTSINSAGSRGPEPAPPAPGTRRIVIAGDSLTFGQGITHPETFGARMQELWRREGRPVEVVLAAAPGYGTRQVLTVIDQVVQSPLPDLLVYVYTHNDVFEDTLVRRTPAGTFELAPEQEGLLRRISHRLHRSVHLYNFLKVRLNVIRDRWRFGSMSDYLDREYREDAPRWLRSQGEIREMARRARLAGLPFLVAVWDPPGHEPGASRYRTSLRSFLESAPIPFLFLTDAVATIPPDRFPVSAVENHPGPEVHRALAGFLKDALDPLLSGS